MEFFATCAAGFEGLLASELGSLGLGQVRPLRGQVSFAGTVADAYRACLWSRIASRVVAVLGRAGASDADALYEGVAQIAWEDQLAPGASFAVDAHGTSATLRNTKFTALRAKDAIVDRMQERCGVRPQTDAARPDLTVVVRLARGRATVGIDLAGEPLFHRGADDLALAGGRHEGALRRDYAAALLAAGGWHRRCRADRPVLVALGAGAPTLVDEARLQLVDQAPGLLRAHWGFEGWRRHDEAAWQALLDEADGRAEAGAAREVRAVLLPLGTGDAVPDVLAGADALVACDLTALHEEDAAREAAAVARAGALAAQAGAGSALVSLARAGLAGVLPGAEPALAKAVFIGGDEGRLAAYDLGEKDAVARTQVELKAGGSVGLALPASEQFVRRLEKDLRLRRKWSRREDVGCYRLYDSDLPDYALSVDVYQPSQLVDEARYGGVGGGPWAVVSEYAAPREIDPALARTRLLDALAAVPGVLGVDAGSVCLRVRSHARGGSQYADGARGGAGGDEGRVRRPARKSELALPAGAHLVDEGGLTFEVNFQGGLDTGLFLDTRDVRGRIREMAKQTRGSKRFLNLFAYTGTASCYAADGGAKHTTTVDLSGPYLAWARRNMARNGFGGPEHEYVQADVLAWVGEQRHTANRWDLIYLDPPTFSNSSRMRSASFEVQRDHVELLIGVSRLLTRAGVCVFCCNLRRFEPDLEALGRAGVVLEDITDHTIPDDFARNRKIHHCYLLRRA